MAINKVIYCGENLIDLTEDTVTPEKLLSGATAHDGSGQQIVGTMIQSSGIDTSDATATTDDIAHGKTAYVNGTKLTGQVTEIASGESNVLVEGTASVDGSDLVISKARSSDALIRSGAIQGSKTALTSLGNAVASDVVAGKTFTSAAGLKVTGTHTEESGLDTSDATAKPSDIASGKTAYVKGSKVTGTLDDSADVKVTYGSMVKDTVKQTVSGVGTVTFPVIKHTVKVKLDDTSKPVLMGTNTEKTVTFNNLLSNYGDAKAYQVLSGKKFTGDNVLNGTGTMADNSGDGDIALTNLTDKALSDYYKQNVGISSAEKAKIISENIKKGVSILGVSGSYEATSSGGSQVKVGTTTSATINTGLSKIDKLIIYAESISNKGAIDIIYTGESEAVVTYCSYYSNYSKSCAVQKRSAFGVSGGTFEWHDTGSYAFASGVTYHWVAIGS